MDECKPLPLMFLDVLSASFSVFIISAPHTQGPQPVNILVV